jgi:hypothetical protein
MTFLTRSSPQCSVPLSRPPEIQDFVGTVHTLVQVLDSQAQRIDEQKLKVTTTHTRAHTHTR